MAKAKKIVSESLESAPVQQTETAVSKFDIASKKVDEAVKSLAKYEKITTTQEQTKALEVLKDANSVSKAIEEKRKELVAPRNKEVKEINDYAKILTAKVDTKVGLIKGVVLQFQKDEEAKAIKVRSKNRVDLLNNLSFVRNDETKTFSLSEVGTLTFQEITTLDDQSFGAIIDNFNEKIKANAEKALESVTVDDELFDVFGSEDDKKEVAEKVEQIKTAAAAPSFSYSGSASVSKLKGTTKTWVFEVTNPKNVPAEYLMVDEAKIRQAVKDGSRYIAGVRIYQKESLTLR